VRTAGLEPPRPRRWSDREIVEALRDWAARYDRPPLSSDWRHAAPDHPSVALAQRRFGSWRAALDAAGLAPRRPEWTRERVLAAIRTHIDRHRRPPLSSQWRRPDGDETPPTHLVIIASAHGARPSRPQRPAGTELPRRTAGAGPLDKHGLSHSDGPLPHVDAPATRFPAPLWARQRLPCCQAIVVLADIPTMEAVTAQRISFVDPGSSYAYRPPDTEDYRRRCESCVQNRSPFLLALCGLAALAAAMQPAIAARPAAAADRDCSDFENQRQAQDYFVDRGGPAQDPDRLDGDGDGMACVIYSR
jgi:hypothetical protein